MGYTAITTKFIGPARVRGSRYKATTTAKLGDDKPRSITRDADHRLGYNQNHDAVAKELATKLLWSGAWVRGELDDGAVYVRVPFSADGMYPVIQGEHIAFVVDELPA